MSFLTCAEQQHYIALGCNGMVHRGPTVFGMLLALSGCTPEHALEIVHKYWELDGLKKEVRLGAIQKSYDLGSQNPN